MLACICSVTGVVTADPAEERCLCLLAFALVTIVVIAQLATASNMNFTTKAQVQVVRLLLGNCTCFKLKHGFQLAKLWYQSCNAKGWLEALQLLLSKCWSIAVQ